MSGSEPSGLVRAWLRLSQGSVRGQTEVNHGSDRGAGKGKDAQGKGTGGSVVQGATPAVAVGGGSGWETQSLGRGFTRGGGNMK